MTSPTALFAPDGGPEACPSRRVVSFQISFRVDLRREACKACTNCDAGLLNFQKQVWLLLRP